MLSILQTPPQKTPYLSLSATKKHIMVEDQVYSLNTSKSKWKTTEADYVF